MNSNGVPKQENVFTPISVILNPDTPVPGKFQCKVKVVDHIPFLTKDFRRSVCQDCRKSFETQVSSCEDCDSNEVKLEYMFSLLLSDGSGYMPTIVSGSDGTAFFRDISAESATIPGINDLLSNLWKLPEDSRDPRVREAVEFACIVETFRVEHSGAEKVRVKLCDTRIPLK